MLFCEYFKASFYLVMQRLQPFFPYHKPRIIRLGVEFHLSLSKPCHLQHEAENSLSKFNVGDVPWAGYPVGECVQVCTCIIVHRVCVCVHQPSLFPVSRRTHKKGLAICGLLSFSHPWLLRFCRQSPLRTSSEERIKGLASTLWWFSPS